MAILDNYMFRPLLGASKLQFAKKKGGEQIFFTFL